MVLSAHQLLSEVQMCHGSPAKLCLALPIEAPYFQQRFLEMILSLRLRVFCPVSVVGLDTVVVESDFKVLEIF